MWAFSAPQVSETTTRTSVACTHFPLFRETIARYMGPDVALLSVGEETARRATLDLWLDHADLLRTLSTEDLDVLLADAVSANKTALSALLLQIKHERDSSGQGRMTL